MPADVWVVVATPTTPRHSAGTTTRASARAMASCSASTSARRVLRPMLEMMPLFTVFRQGRWRALPPASSTSLNCCVRHRPTRVAPPWAKVLMRTGEASNIVTRGVAHKTCRCSLFSIAAAHVAVALHAAAMALLLQVVAKVIAWRMLEEAVMVTMPSPMVLSPGLLETAMILARSRFEKHGGSWTGFCSCTASKDGEAKTRAPMGGDATGPCGKREECRGGPLQARSWPPRSLPSPTSRGGAPLLKHILVAL